MNPRKCHEYQRHIHQEQAPKGLNLVVVFESGTVQHSSYLPHVAIQLKLLKIRASLVAQWLRICLPMQGTWVRALVWEDPTFCRATRPVSHNC